MDKQRKNNSTGKAVSIFWTENDIERLLCYLCSYILLIPKQLICCGQRVCETCSDSKLQHLSECPFCLETGMPQARYDKGFTRELERLSIKCPRCNDQWFGLFMDLPRHLREHYDLNCEHCDEKFIFPQQLRIHSGKNCRKRIVSCPLNFLGCSKEVIYEDMCQHYLSDQHQHCILWFITTLFPKTSERSEKLVSQSFFDEQYRQMLTESAQQVDSMVQQVNPMIETCGHLTLEAEKEESNIREIRIQSGKIKESCDKNEKNIENINQILSKTSKLLDEIKSMSFGGPKLLSSDGTYKFRVNIGSIVDNQQTVQSEPVHTSQSGYKLTISCGVYVDEKSQTRYVSLSFIILVGEFDAILSWPFIYPISLSILDLNVTRNNIVHSIQWQAEKVTMRRPMNSGNCSFSIAKFCPVDTLLNKSKNYLQDGFILIQLQIDFLTPCMNDGVTKERPMTTTTDFMQSDILTNTLKK